MKLTDYETFTACAALSDAVEALGHNVPPTPEQYALMRAYHFVRKAGE